MIIFYNNTLNYNNKIKPNNLLENDFKDDTDDESAVDAVGNCEVVFNE